MDLSEQTIRAALMQSGVILPTDETAVEALDRAHPISTEPQLPASLSFEAILSRLQDAGPAQKSKPNPLRFANTPAMAGLARAARNGNELSPEVLAKMAADRARVEEDK